MEDTLYELHGDERKEVLEEKVPCGKSITTAYFDAQSGLKVRQDVKIEVDREIFRKEMAFATSSLSTGLFQMPAELQKAVEQFQDLRSA